MASKEMIDKSKEVQKLQINLVNSRNGKEIQGKLRNYKYILKNEEMIEKSKKITNISYRVKK